MRRALLILLLSIQLVLVSCNTVMPMNSSCHTNTTDILTKNTVPEGSRLLRSAYSTNMTEGINFLTIRTDLTANELHTHYETQTIEHRSDWQLLQTDTSDSTASSSWSIIDNCGDLWNGSIIIYKTSSENDAFVTIRVVRAKR